MPRILCNTFGLVALKYTHKLNLEKVIFKTKTSENYWGKILKNKLNQDELSTCLQSRTMSVHCRIVRITANESLRDQVLISVVRCNWINWSVLCLSFFSLFLHLKPDIISHISSAHIRSHRPRNPWWRGVCFCLPVCFASEGLSDRMNDRCWWVKVRLPQTIVHSV